MVELDKLKQSEQTKFDSTIDFIADEITKWLFTFVSVNEEYSTLAAQLQEEVRDIEEEIFNEHVK